MDELDLRHPVADAVHDGSPPRAPAQGIDPASRLRVMLWLLAILSGLALIRYAGPPFVERFQYAATYGRERAEVDAAREGLGEVDIAAVNQASRLVAQAVGPSLVHIRTVGVTSAVVVRDERDYLFGRGRRQQFQSQGTGSGVIVDREGYIVTNRHVVLGADTIEVQLSDGRRLPARVVGRDALTDLAVLRIDDGDLIAAPWGESSSMEVGDMVWALGSPFGLERTVTFGIVSAKGRAGTASQYQDLMQTDAAVNPGNSGGPLVNIHGEVVGINTAIVGDSYRGVSFAIPSDIARDVYDRLRAEGKVARGWLGVKLRELTPDVARESGVPEETGGVLVWSVLPDSPAERAGLESRDVIVEWNGQPVDNPTALSRAVAAAKVGSRAKVRVLREGEARTFSVDIAERPPESTLPTLPRR